MKIEHWRHIEIDDDDDEDLNGADTFVSPQFRPAEQFDKSEDGEEFTTGRYVEEITCPVDGQTYSLSMTFDESVTFDTMRDELPKDWEPTPKQIDEWRRIVFAERGTLEAKQTGSRAMRAATGPKPKPKRKFDWGF